jgi:predicted HAD superfamily phosphohydrolase
MKKIDCRLKFPESEFYEPLSRFTAAKVLKAARKRGRSNVSFNACGFSIKDHGLKIIYSII